MGKKTPPEEIVNRINESLAFRNFLGIDDEPEPGSSHHYLLIRFMNSVKERKLDIFAKPGSVEHGGLLECLQFVRSTNVSHALNQVSFFQCEIEDFVAWAQQTQRTSVHCRMPCPVDQDELDYFIHTHNRTLDSGVNFFTSFLGVGRECPGGFFDIEGTATGRRWRLCVVLRPHLSTHSNSFSLAAGEWFLLESSVPGVLYGANLIELFAYERNMSFRDACNQLAESFGEVRSTAKNYWMKRGWSQVRNSISPQMPGRVAVQIEGETFGEWYQYVSPQGIPIGVVYYHQKGNASFRLEQTLWADNNSQEYQWELRPFSRELPLFAANLIHSYPSATVVIVESERICSLAKKIPACGDSAEVLTTWPRGYSSLDDASFHILHGRNVQCHIGIDDDAYIFAKKIYKKLTQAGVACVSFIVNEKMGLERFNYSLPNPISFEELEERFHSSVEKVDRKESHSTSGTSISELANLSGENFSIPFVLDPIIEEGDTLMLLAKPDTGKSWLALLMGMTMANGGGFGLLSASEPKSVLYVYGERGKKLARQAMLIANNIGVEDRAADMVFFPSLEGKTSDQCLDITTDEGRRAVEKASSSFDVVIFDTIGSLTAKKIDHPDGWKKAEAFFARLTLRGKTIIFLHHTSSADSQEPRGTQWMKAYVDTIMLMKSCGDNSVDIHFTQKHSENPRQLEAMKSAWSLTWERQGDSLSWNLQLLDEEVAKDKINVASGPLSRSTPQRRKAWLVGQQRSDGGISLEKAASELGCSHDTIYRDIRELKKNGWHDVPSFVVKIISSKG